MARSKHKTSKLKRTQLIKKQEYLQEIFCQTAEYPETKTQHSWLISRLLIEYLEEIDKIIVKCQTTPASLKAPSRRAYAWMKFLTSPENLELHFEQVCLAQSVGEELLEKAGLGLQELRIKFSNLSYLYRYKTGDDGFFLELNQGFLGADEDILREIIIDILFKEKTDKERIAEQFSLSEAFRKILRELDEIVEIEAESPQGNFHNLEQIFHQLNREYFADSMSQPRLSWSQKASRYKLGYFDCSRDKIVVSSILDSSNVPSYVVEHVLYHELLHKYHSGKWVNGRMYCHTTEFRGSEWDFKDRTKALVWLAENLFPEEESNKSSLKKEPTIIPYSKYIEMMKEKGETL